MKKLFLFFSMLFFVLLPQVSADFDPMEYYLYFKDNSTDKYLYNTLTAIKSESCSYDYCSYGGSSKTIAENLESLISELKNNNYTFFITIGVGSPNSDVSNLNNVYIDIIDTSRTANKLSLYPGKSSLSHLDFKISSKEIDIYNSSSDVYSWRIGHGYFEEFDINSINDYVSTHSSSLTDLTVLSIYNLENGFGPRGYSLYYTNLSFDYKLDPFSFRIFTDYVGTSGNAVDFTVNDSVGNFYNRTMMLSWYVNNFEIDNDPIIPGQKPNEGDTDASNQDIVDSIGGLNDSVNDLNDSINSSDTSGAENSFDDFFSNFQTDDHGLTAIIKTPLEFIRSFLTQTCTPLVLPLPFVDTSVTLPCMEYVYNEFFGLFFQAYQLITNGIISYWVAINIFRIVKNMKDSKDNTIEVLDL